MFEISKTIARTCSMLGQRGSIFGLASLECAKSDEKFILITADLATLSGMDRYIKTYPDQFINVGIAEQNMLGIAAGLAAEGFHPVVTTYATFVTMRSCEQIRHYLGYMNSPIVVVGSGAGLSQGFAGNTHYTIEDISMMRAIPNLQILSPSDAASAVKLFNLSVSSQKPTYIRLTGNLNCPIVYKSDSSFSFGKSNLIVEGDDISIIACGTMVSTAIKTANILKEDGISAAVTDMYSIKPIDEAAILSTKSSKLIVTIEEHNKIGGLGAAVAEVITSHRNMPQLLRLGISDTFDLASDYDGLLQQNRLTPELVAEDIKEALRNA
jgi:transketolase